LKKQTVVLAAGQKFTVEKSVAHRFSNTSDAPVVFTTVIVPGSTGFENALRILYGLAADGETNGKGEPKSLLNIAVISQMSDMHPSGAARMFAPLFGLFTRIAERKGITAKLLRSYCSGQ